MQNWFEGSEWALILGGSSGLGLASARKFAQKGLSVCVVHRDLRGAMARVQPEFDAISSGMCGEQRFFSINADALSTEGRAQVLGLLSDKGARVKVLLHSIAAGNLKPLRSQAGAPRLEAEDLARTVHAMGTSLVDWVQALQDAGLFGDRARVLALTSEGSQIGLPHYAAVSVAKAALEAVVRSIALEFAPVGLRCNAVRAGVCETPGLARIPGSDALIDAARLRNPFRRLTTPDDVAGVVVSLCLSEMDWVNGAVVMADGGEGVSGRACP